MPALRSYFIHFIHWTLVNKPSPHRRQEALIKKGMNARRGSLGAIFEAPYHEKETKAV